MRWKLLVSGAVGFLLLVLVGSVWHGRSGAFLIEDDGATVACPEPLVIDLPVDINKVTSVLYPGQVRGGDFKRHGGFRFDNSTNQPIEVKAPLDAVLSGASRYIEMGEIQYLFDFESACGVRYRFDHLLALAPRFAAVVATLPEAQPDDSRTSRITEEIRVAKGEVIATAVGVSNNTFVDFGVYEMSELFVPVSPLSKPLCWLDLLPSNVAIHLKSLPAADQQSGTQSEYCR